MEWTVHGERALYESPWVSLFLVDVEVPEGARFDHHVVRLARPAAGVVVVDRRQDLGECVLLLWRHRFISGAWGWEVPAGGVDAGESVVDGAAREVLEETGWRPGPLRRLHGYAPSIGLSDQRFELFVADGATHVGEPVDVAESERVEWVPTARVRELVSDGQVVDGLTLTALLWWLTFERGSS